MATGRQNKRARYALSPRPTPHDNSDDDDDDDESQGESEAAPPARSVTVCSKSSASNLGMTGVSTISHRLYESRDHEQEVAKATLKLCVAEGFKLKQFVMDHDMMTALAEACTGAVADGSVGVNL